MDRQGESIEDDVSDDPDWRQFESAVARFAAALDPNAAVRCDVKLPDAQTRRPRQRDVWIEASIGGHWPARILVSCKNWKRKLSQTDVDHFHGELMSSSAQMGVLYARAGFSRPAVDKANKLGISCCRLYRNQPADLPESIIFHSYCCTSRISISVVEPPDPCWSIATWHDLFAVEVEDEEEGTTTILDAIVTAFHGGERKAITAERPNPQFPRNWSCELRHGVPGRTPLRIRVQGSWNYYKGKLEAHLLDGSYSVTTGDFKGKQYSPPIDLRGATPGVWWEQLRERPTSVEAGVVIAVLYEGDAREALVRELGPKAVS